MVSLSPDPLPLNTTSWDSTGHPGPATCRTSSFVWTHRPRLTARLQRPCEITVPYVIENPTNVAVVNAFNLSLVLTSVDHLGKVTTGNFTGGGQFNDLAAGGKINAVDVIATGVNCYNPNCEIQAFVDSNDDVVERDENDNTDGRLDGTDVADLAVFLINPPTLVDCPAGPGSCEATIQYRVENNGHPRCGYAIRRPPGC